MITIVVIGANRLSTAQLQFDDRCDADLVFNELKLSILVGMLTMYDDYADTSVILDTYTTPWLKELGAEKIALKEYEKTMPREPSNTTHHG